MLQGEVESSGYSSHTQVPLDLNFFWIEAPEWLTWTNLILAIPLSRSIIGQKGKQVIDSLTGSQNKKTV